MTGSRAEGSLFRVTTAPEPFDEGAWAEFLSKELGSRVSVRFGRARSSVLRVVRAPRGARGGRGELVVHMSEFFGRAPLEVRTSVARWLSAGKRARRSVRELDRWIDDELAREGPRAPDPQSLVTRGRTVDLAPLLAEVVAAEFRTEFAHAAPPAITFGRVNGRRARRTLRLGSYDPRAHLVRIHPVLDQDFVPRWFVRYIVFHELLHAAMPVERGAHGRRIFHGPRFRAREAAYADYERALEWERDHIEELLRRPTARGRASSRTHRPVVGALRGVQGWLFPR
ncbi:MAG: hypothetical protein L6Q99_16385 [Planctomycetes bacterium]|nr:hypothetical protein [Planctomycetota bacterium]